MIPPTYLRDGDVVEVVVEGLGGSRNDIGVVTILL